MSLSWRNRINTILNWFVVGLIMCLLSMVINWAVLKIHAIAGSAGLVVLALVIGALISWRHR